MRGGIDHVIRSPPLTYILLRDVCVSLRACIVPRMLARSQVHAIPCGSRRRFWPIKGSSQNMGTHQEQLVWLYRHSARFCIEIDSLKGSKEIHANALLCETLRQPEIDKYATPGCRMLINFAACICKNYVAYLYQEFIRADEVMQQENNLFLSLSRSFVCCLFLEKYLFPIFNKIPFMSKEFKNI